MLLFSFASLSRAAFITAATVSVPANLLQDAPVTCDAAVLARAPATDGYTVEGTFCEGLVAGNVSGSLDIVSVTTAPVLAAPDGTVVLGAPYARGPVDVLGSPLVASVAYRVDGKINIPHLASWADTKLRRTTFLRISDFGFVGFQPDAAGAVTPICAVAKPADCRRTGRLVVMFRSAVNLLSVEAKVFRHSNGRWDAGTTVQLATAGLPASIAAPLRIEIARDVDSVSVQLFGAQSGGLTGLHKSIVIAL